MDWKEVFLSHPAVKRASDFAGKHKRVRLVLPENSFRSFFWYAFFRRVSRPVLVVESDQTAAEFLYSELRGHLPEEQIGFLPASFKHIRNPLREEPYESSLRLKILNRILHNGKPQLILTYPEAFLEKVPAKEFFERKAFEISVGHKADPGFLNELLFDLGYERVDLVTEPGEFAWFGRVVDVFPAGELEPFRVEFDAEKVVRIRIFDVESQLTGREAETLVILSRSEEDYSRVSLETLLPADTLIYVDNPVAMTDLLRSLPKEKVFTERIHTVWRLSGEKFVWLSPRFTQVPEVQTRVKDLPPFRKNFNLFLNELQNDFEAGFDSIITCTSGVQCQRLDTILKNREEFVPSYKLKKIFVLCGFKDVDTGISIYPDHQIFERPVQAKKTVSKEKKQKTLLREMSGWQQGDYIVHTDYGIGIYEGAVKIEKDGGMHEVVKLRYKDGDVLYVSIHSLHKLTKYRGREGKPPKIYKLGSAAWERTKQKTKKRLKKLAFDLIKLYAERKNRKGFAFAPDSMMQLELESSFMYEDTPDQKRALEEIKRDMESDRPMDRLVCGDVGFGKTEVALRAAFKAVDNGKQVAVLVPTTVLAFQHYGTFSERLKNFPVTVDYLNRFRTAKEKKRIREELRQGKIDIIIGTHQLVSGNMEFKDLGLLIIDEEQKFGVNVKEKIKELKKNIDVLTLTATPIPRTLQFSLMGERDLSVINTPPPNRYPVETFVVKFNREIIGQAVKKELDRGGQVFFCS
jgi:transcription-repair coupling factor (superfamily II helicase)